MTHPEFVLDLFLIRHGESATNVTLGMAVPFDLDPPLTERGAAQVRTLASRLKTEGVRFDRVYTSSLRRAIRSGEVLLEALGEPGRRFTPTPSLDEIRVQLVEGVPFDQALDAQGHLLRALQGKWFRYGDGAESERAVERRVISWLEDELLNSPVASKPGRFTVAAISHGHAIRCTLHGILGFDERYVRRIQLYNASITRLSFTTDGWIPMAINDAWHTYEIGDAIRDHGRHRADV
ncbi:MAG: histidine phosphatase family protein [Chloroflexi bacterium]|nr:histidine phosphatase family protein [Chloroflexota bacterium]